jgi:hypothetical protein
MIAHHRTFMHFMAKKKRLSTSIDSTSKLEILRQFLLEGEEGDAAGELDMSAIRQNAIRRMITDEQILSFAEALISIPSVGRESDFERFDITTVFKLSQAKRRLTGIIRRIQKGEEIEWHLLNHNQLIQ